MEMRIRVDCFFPNVEFRFYGIRGLKIVSTPLSVRLTREGGNQEFTSGFVTLDSSKRVLPILCNDSHARRYPLVGIWVTSKSLNDKNVWAA
jgi:hypothetical protein